MNTHELAAKLLSLPDVPAVTMEPGDALFSISEVKPINAVDGDRKDVEPLLGLKSRGLRREDFCHLFYKHDPKYNESTPIVVVELV